MKKINVLIIAATLVAVHVLLFLAFIGTKDSEAQPPAPSPAPVHEAWAEPSPAPAAGINIPALQPLRTVETTEKASVPSHSTIAVPGNRPDYLRTDRPDRRTSKVYPSLVGDPYQGAIVVDANTGKILFEERASTYGYPASVTKLMTLLIVLDQVEAGKIDLSDKVQITREGMGIGGSQAYLDVRESGLYSVDDLLKALMIHSANDAARVLGIHVAGSKDAFVSMMNRKAHELGMNSTIYHSEHGLPPSDGSQPDISTPYDIALLSLAVLRHPQTLHYTGTQLTYLPPSPLRKERFMLANRNALVEGASDGYAGCDGLKTGYHSMGGWSLAATAERNGHRIISVVLGAPDKKTRNDVSKKLLDKGFEALAE